jgi:menaquinol-cytochrome c reductase iron-sulfur subunit
MTTEDASRRSFLGCLTSLLLGLLAVLLAAPAVAYFLSPLRRKDAEGAGPAYLDAGPLADYPVGQWRLAALEQVHQDGWRKSRASRPVWVRREAQGQPGVTVLSALCPHLGCPINFLADRTQFECRCHGGRFDADGRRVSGPPPRGLDPLEVEVRGGRLWVRWQEFKIGVAERVPVTV